MIAFDEAHRAVHYPADRRFRIWIRPSILIGAGIVILAITVAAWIEVAVFGMPRVPPVPQISPDNFTGPQGFPVWVRYCHVFNFFFVMFLIRSGLSILMDHPRLYFNDHCTPGSEWIRFTPLQVPTDRPWTAKDDARYILRGPAHPATGTRSVPEKNQLIAVDIQTSPTFRVEQAHALFPLGNVPWDVAPDGRRFLVVKEPEAAAGEAKLQVVVNWFEELRQKAPVGKR